MKTLDIIRSLGFAEDEAASLCSLAPVLRCDLGNFRLEASPSVSKYMRAVVLIGIVSQNPSWVSDFHFEVPDEVESREQGVAWIAHFVEKYQPVKRPAWLAEGLQWQDHLPWVRERMAYHARPQCTVDRDWFRVAAKKLREVAVGAGAAEIAVFRFDGVVLRVETSGGTLAMPAKGSAWDAAYAVAASDLTFLPKRLVDQTIQLSVWENRLTIGNRRWSLAEAAYGGSPRGERAKGPE